MRNNLSKSEYSRIHYFIGKSKKKSGFCSNCGCNSKKPHHWALIKGSDYSYDINDYIELCVSCHRKYDMTDSEIERLKIIGAKQGRNNFNNYLKSTDRKGTNHPNHKPVVKLSKDGSLLKVYDYLSLVKQDGYKLANVAMCLTGRNKTAYKYKWSYLNK